MEVSNLRSSIHSIHGGASIEEAVEDLLGEDLLLEMADPSLFRVALPVTEIKLGWGMQINYKTLKELKSGVFNGLKGISDRREIRFHFLKGERDALLIMKANAVRKANPHIQEMPYDDPDGMLADDMKMLTRIWGDEYGSKWTLVRSLFNVHVVPALLKKGEKYTGSGRGWQTILSKFEYYARELPRINYVSDLAKWFHKAVIKGEETLAIFKHLTKKDWEELLRDALLSVGKTYKYEGEWFIHGDIFNVPKGSTLVIMYNGYPEDFTNLPEGLYNRWEAGQLTDADREGPYESVLRDMSRQKDIIKDLKTQLGSQYKLKFLTRAKYRLMKRAFTDSQ